MSSKAGISQQPVHKLGEDSMTSLGPGVHFSAFLQKEELQCHLVIIWSLSLRNTRGFWPPPAGDAGVFCESVQWRLPPHTRFHHFQIRGVEDDFPLLCSARACLGLCSSQSMQGETSAPSGYKARAYSSGEGNCRARVLLEMSLSLYITCFYRVRLMEIFPFCPELGWSCLAQPPYSHWVRGSCL